MATLLPTIKWAQRKDKLFLTVEHRDIQNEKIEWVSPTHLRIEFGSDNRQYATDLELFGEINVDDSKWNKNGLRLQFSLTKKEEGPYWKRLTKDDKKWNHISIDWTKYIDEDEEDEEAKKGLGAEWDPSAMQGFGGMGGMPGMGGMGGMPGMGGMGGFPGMMGGMPGMGGMGGFPGMGGMGGDDDSDDEEGEEGHDHDHEGHEHHEGCSHDHGKGKLDDLDKEEEIPGAK